MKITRPRLINPIAQAMLRNRKAKQIVPNKKKYNRKRDKNKRIKDETIS
tara:strand:- start:333 stop:479 length:147 start_codon:yes stop_codon:yes gene_type:complete